jgi:sialic acid synthase SpsE
LDFGSGNTSKNNYDYIKLMIDKLAKIHLHNHEVIIKWQLFKEAGQNIPLTQAAFNYAYHYAKIKGYQITASVFDIESLKFLLHFDIPFVKIANNRSLDYLIGEIPRKIPVYVSVSNAIGKELFTIVKANKSLCCVSNYPAKLIDYDKLFNKNRFLYDGFSDHTTNFDLWHKYEPEIIEWHYKLDDSTGLDAGDFARTPKQLAEVL